MTLEIGPEHAAAQVAASVVFADTGPAASSIRLYSAPGGAGVLLADIALAKPCGTLTAGVLTFNTAVAQPLALANGIPRSGVWLNGNGLLVARGTVTDGAHTGDFRVSGAATAPGDDSPMLYAGGVVLLGALTFD